MAVKIAGITVDAPLPRGKQPGEGHLELGDPAPGLGVRVEVGKCRVHDERVKVWQCEVGGEEVFLRIQV
jgi:hypothetical protein